MSVEKKSPDILQQNTSTKKMLDMCSLAVIMTLAACSSGGDDGPGPTPPPNPQQYTALANAQTVDGVPSKYAYDEGETETVTIKADEGKKLPSNINIDITLNGNVISDNYEILPGNEQFVTTIVDLADILQNAGYPKGEDISGVGIVFEKGSDKKTFSLNKTHINKTNTGTNTFTD